MRVIVLSVLLCVFALAPQFADAALVPMACQNPETCGTCQLVLLINNVINFIITLASFIAMGIFVYAGILMVTSGGNTDAVNKAKTYFTNVVIGYVLILAAFIIINLIMSSLISPGNTALGWQTVECIYPTKARNETVYDENARLGDAGGYTGGGSCTAYTSGPCSESAIRAAGFGSLSADAAKLVGQESSCNPTVGSKTDRTTDDRPYSYCTWQINLAAHNLNCGGTTLNCTDAFVDSGNRHPKYNTRIQTVVNEELYNRCRTAVVQPECCNATAARIANTDGDLGAWACSARACGVYTSRNSKCPL